MAKKMSKTGAVKKTTSMPKAAKPGVKKARAAKPASK